MGVWAGAKREAGGQIELISFLVDIKVASSRLDALGQWCEGIGLSATEFTDYYMGWCVNASGSSHTGYILVRSLYDPDYCIGIAKEWAGIEESRVWPGHCSTNKAWAGN